MIIIVAAYAYQKTDIWLNRKDIDIMTSTQSRQFPDDYIFNFDMGLNFAIGFTAYDNETENILHPSYGNLKFTTYEWGEDENGDSFVKFVEI